MNVQDLSPITVKFAEPINGYWDGGKKDGGVFEPTIHYADDPKRSYVEWGCWRLNHYFRFPLHFKKGKKQGLPLANWEVMARARRHLQKHTRVPATII